MDNKLILTVKEPEDLYIIGAFSNVFTSIPEDTKNLYRNRIIDITDDYATLTLRGVQSGNEFCVETEGSFLVVTKSEWENDFLLHHNDYDPENDHNEPYGFVIKNYSGDVRIAVLDEDGNEAEWEYNPNEYMNYHNENYVAVLINSGYTVHCKHLNWFFGFDSVEGWSFENDTLRITH